MRLGVVVDTGEAVDALERSRHPFHVWLKVDSGYHRAGVDPCTNAAVDLARRLAVSPSLTFEGILTHSGHAYHGRSRAEIVAVAEQERRVMVEFATRLREAGVAVPCVSVGSTPAMSVVERLDGVNEARPGVLPNHSCLTAAHFDEYHVVRGGEIVDRWKIWRGR